MKKQHSFYPSSKNNDKNWVSINADGVILGRLASEVASILRGKHKPEFTDSVDMGDFVIIYNASKVKVSGKKVKQKKYYRHSGYPGGLKVASFEDVLNKNPERIIFEAVKGMLPHNRLGRKMITKLKVYSGIEHPHVAQTPVEKTL